MRWKAVAEQAARRVPAALLVITLVALASGGISWWLDEPALAQNLWSAGTLVALAPAAWWVITAIRHHRFGADIIAVLSLVGTLAIGEHLAGALIAVMLATGRALDAAAERRARRDLTALTDRVPPHARRIDPDGVTTVPLQDVLAGDRLIVGPGEVVPIDGLICSDAATLDESVLTGESVYAERQSGDAVRSGAVNAGAAIEVRATATAEHSTYAGIVRLAQEAAAQSAPVVRLADRIAAWFLPLTLAVAGAAWLLSGSAERAVAVLVVATPCPLLLAAPVAIVSGLSRAARIGVIVRSGGALETLGRTTTLVLDKTGTLTTGRPIGSEVLTAPGWTETDMLRLAATADRFSPHVLAPAIVEEANIRGIVLGMPHDLV
jgi:cation transport ATPase